MIASTPGAFFILILTIGVSLAGLYANPAFIDACLFRPYYLMRKKQY